MHKRSRHIYTLVGFAIVSLLVWWFARISLCWGGYGWFGVFLCHLNIATYLSLAGGIYVLVLFVRDLGRDYSQDRTQPGAFKLRVARRQLNALEPHERRHATASASLMIVGLVFVLWLVFLSGVRF